METTGIYRDPWERRTRPPGESDRRLRDVVDRFNYLSKEDYREAKQRAYREQDRRQEREWKAQAVAEQRKMDDE
jgi:hypothetical protein